MMAMSSMIIKKIALTYVLVDDKDATFARIVGRICDEIKQQPWIVVVYWLLERQIYCKYVNNQQLESPAVHDAINKIAAL